MYKKKLEEMRQDYLRTVTFYYICTNSIENLVSLSTLIEECDFTYSTDELPDNVMKETQPLIDIELQAEQVIEAERDKVESLLASQLERIAELSRSEQDYILGGHTKERDPEKFAMDYMDKLYEIDTVGSFYEFYNYIQTIPEQSN